MSTEDTTAVRQYTPREREPGKGFFYTNTKKILEEQRSDLTPEEEQRIQNMPDFYGSFCIPREAALPHDIHFVQQDGSIVTVRSGSVLGCSLTLEGVCFLQEKSKGIRLKVCMNRYETGDRA